MQEVLQMLNFILRGVIAKCWIDHSLIFFRSRGESRHYFIYKHNVGEYFNSTHIRFFAILKISFFNFFFEHVVDKF